MAFNVDQIKANIINCDCKIIRIYQKKGESEILVYTIGARTDKDQLSAEKAASQFEEFVKNHPNMGFMVEAQQKPNDPVKYQWPLSTKEVLVLNGKTETVDITAIRENIKKEIFQEIQQQEERKAFEKEKEELKKQLKELESYGERLSMIAEYALQKIIGKIDLSKFAPQLNGIIPIDETMADVKQGTQSDYEEIFKILKENVSIEDLKVLAKAIQEKPSIVKKAIAFL